MAYNKELSCILFLVALIWFHANLKNNISDTTISGTTHHGITYFKCHVMLRNKKAEYRDYNMNFL